jgi:hypothetical protein
MDSEEFERRIVVGLLLVGAVVGIIGGLAMMFL